MEHVIRKMRTRKSEEGKESRFTINGRNVDARKIQRFSRRRYANKSIEFPGQFGESSRS
jgi:hypothetical protein